MKRRLFVSNLAAAGTALLTVPSMLKAGVVCSPVSAVLSACTAGIASDLANITMDRSQNQSNWCWAACIQMVFLYNGLNVSQQEIVRTVFGQLVNLPGSPEDILAALNRRWTDANGDDFDVQGDVYSVSPVTAAQDLANDFPLIVGTLGHAVVLSAVDYYRDLYGNGQIVSAVVRDPLPGRGKRRLTPAEWVYMTFAVRIRVTRA
jgi:ABC-type bacteriocin/lantibiotic exporter with double-glycine peptidase domain